MKTSTLIKLLQEEDPSGELECCVGNRDIYGVCVEPAYYDGCLQILKRDETRNGYNIVGAKFESEGTKLQLHTMSIEIAILDNPKLPIEYTEYSRRECFDKVQKWRIDSREIK